MEQNPWQCAAPREFRTAEVEAQFLEGMLGELRSEGEPGIQREIEKISREGIRGMKNNQNLFLSPGGKGKGHFGNVFKKRCRSISPANISRSS